MTSSTSHRDSVCFRRQRCIVDDARRRLAGYLLTAIVATLFSVVEVRLALLSNGDPSISDLETPFLATVFKSESFSKIHQLNILPEICGKQ